MRAAFKKERNVYRFEDYLQDLRRENRAETTLRIYSDVLEAWRSSRLSPKAWLATLSDRGLKPATVNQRRAILRTYHEWLCVQGIIPINPLEKTRPVKTNLRLRRTLSVDEVTRLIGEGCAALNSVRVGDPNEPAFGHLSPAAYRSRLAAMIAVSVTSGLRVSELLRLELGDIDLEKRKGLVVGKGDKQRALKIGKLAKLKLEEWWVYREALPGDLVFCGAKGQQVQPRVYARQLAEACWWAGIDPPCNPHMLRHTFATMSVDSGIPVADVQVMLGHDNIQTTMKYVTRNPERGWDRFGEHALENLEDEDAVA